MKRPWDQDDDFLMILIFLAVFFSFCLSLLMSWEAVP